MFYMVENIAKDQEHCDVLETSLAANRISLVWLGLMVHIINSGLFDSGIFGVFLFSLQGINAVKCSMVKRNSLRQTCHLISSECLHIPNEPVSYLLLCIDSILQVFIVLYINCERLIQISKQFHRYFHNIYIIPNTTYSFSCMDKYLKTVQSADISVFFFHVHLLQISPLLNHNFPLWNWKSCEAQFYCFISEKMKEHRKDFQQGIKYCCVCAMSCLTTVSEGNVSWGKARSVCLHRFPLLFFFFFSKSHLLRYTILTT